jgi:hypothetical protein
MRSPFRYQVCETDCFPTSVLNGLSHLFERRCIPGAVVQRVYLYSLDGVSRGAITGDGTTEPASRLLAAWLSDYRTPRFSVGTAVITGRDVRLNSNSVLGQRVARGAVAVCDVSERLRFWHSALMLRMSDGWAEWWDPYKRSTLRDMAGRAELIESDGYGARQGRPTHPADHREAPHRAVHHPYPEAS